MPGPLRRFAGLALGTALGEAAGLAVVGTVSRLAAEAGGAARPPSPTALVLVMATAGLAEGVCIGVGQSLALGPYLDRRGARWRWVAGSGAGILVAWLLGILASDIEPSSVGLDASRGLFGVAAAWGLVVGTSLGVAQRAVWRFSRRSVPGWVMGTAISWAIGLSAGAMVSALAPAPDGLGTAALSGAAAGATIGLVAGAGQALALLRFADPPGAFPGSL